MNRIRTTTRTARTAALALALAGAAAAASLVPAAASPAPAGTARPAHAPGFLTAAHLPTALTPWTAGPVTRGLPPEGSACLAGAVPARGTSHRDFRTELDTGARQTTTVAAGEAQAVRLARTLRRAVATCLERSKAQDPGLVGETRYHGTVDAGDGAHVYSIDTAYPEAGATDIALFSVGRDGRIVTVVEWGQLGDLDGAPLDGFRTTTRTALARLR
ncbi:hypothetical protein NPS70_09325 [Streptomyces sp. C10-9-1]|uniref:hypothetical protein n=1 Tax=Streptomyces sp. C10-9-1 TaxID=1859285 RepID=UPI0021120270|nr:hypothetical protein [Streptomyces sp. C10-9-1]MCQ6553393.1 hypothetical protein [Streptomyces sp. C10-9-1]